MEPDFSLPGRERALAEAYFHAKSRDRLWEFNFALWTLLERIIWAIKPPDTYCVLDGFDFDWAFEDETGFVGVGRVWHLPEPGVPGDIAAIMAVKFEPGVPAVQEAKIWIGPLVPRRGKAPPVTGLEFNDFFAPSPNIDAHWKPAFRRDADGWHLSEAFDLSVFLLPRRDETI